MSTQIELIEEITRKVFESKNYRNLNENTIRRVVSDLVDKYPQKLLEKEVKNKLHQIWGAFYDQNPNFNKILAGLKESVGDAKKSENLLIQTLKIHSSTSERSLIFEEFWQKIRSELGEIKTIVDYGCGINILTLLLTQKSWNINYLGFDIDELEVEFLNNVIDIYNLNSSFKVQIGDLLTQDLIQSDVTLLLKILPTLEQQNPGFSKKLILNIPSTKIVVSFPTFSIGGRRKNMKKNYASWFEDLMHEINFDYKEFVFDTELVYIINK